MIDDKETSQNTNGNLSDGLEIGKTKKVDKFEPKSAEIKSSKVENGAQESPTKVETVEKLVESKDIQESGPTWIDAICVVTFDLDEGQLVEYMLPPKGLTPQDQKLLSLLSFPDSNAFGSEGFCKYVFSLKKMKDYDQYGFSYFKQRKDPSISRGFFQKAIVLVTKHPYISFFKSLLDVIAPVYFESTLNDRKEEYIQHVYSTIQQWPKPTPRTKIELEILGTKLSVHIPKPREPFQHTMFPIKLKKKTASKPEEKRSHSENKDANLTKSHSKPAEIDQSDEEKKEQINNGWVFMKKEVKEENNLSSILNDVNLSERGILQDINIFSLLQFEKIHLIWKLWELTLTNQPLLIISDSPTQCSELVLGLISLISPLDYNGDTKPYFTVYDPSYVKFQEQYENKIIKECLIGVTNPLFLRSLKNFPNILHLDGEYESQARAQAKSQFSSQKVKWLVSTGEIFIQEDPNLLKMLILSGSEEVAAINNNLIRKSFRELTDAFLQAFAEYFALQHNDIKKFDEKEFLSFVEQKKFRFKSFFSSSSKIVKLYARFLKSETVSSPSNLSFLVKFSVTGFKLATQSRHKSVFSKCVKRYCLIL